MYILYQDYKIKNSLYMKLQKKQPIMKYRKWLPSTVQRNYPSLQGLTMREHR